MRDRLGGRHVAARHQRPTEGTSDISRHGPNPAAALRTRLPAPDPAAAPGAAPPADGWTRADDADVLTASVAGDDAAWAELVARYGRLVVSVPRRYGLGREACEDIFQEVFAILVRQLPGIRRRTGLPKWFITTTHRVCRQWFKQLKHAAGDGSELLSGREPPPDLLVHWERQQMVRQALRRLGGHCEQLLLALYTEQGVASYEEVAAKLDMPEGSIGPARARCLRKLLEIMEPMKAAE